MLKFAIVGLGGLGKSHLTFYFNVKKHKDVELVALCDIDPEQLQKKVELNIGTATVPVDLSQYHLYTDMDEMLEKESLDFIITAVPTYLHAELAVKAMDKGIHVFSEKPMALNLEQCQSMVDAAKRNNVKLQIGQCIRFSPQYQCLRDLVRSGKYGKVIRAEFTRISAAPLWSWNNWFMNFDMSGGAVLDLHVHDVDFVQWTFGMPKSVMSMASHYESGFDAITSNYGYDGFYVTTMTDWSLAPGYPFTTSGIVSCEGATIVLSQDEHACVSVFERGVNDGKSNIHHIPTYNEGDLNYYELEMIEFIDCIEKKRDSDIISAESTMDSIRLALIEQESANKGEKVYV
ncbi:MAG: Gfo/Idh/MocA family oxidoreductase [Oscillospiraceae bacterium]|nr:Gfo/Idh/MocA family oxidoreductase [Oscillospiraceae bacterium]